MSRTSRAKQRRVWVPTVGHSMVVEKWVWTKARGLRVTYKDGIECESSWGSLKTFQRALREGREHAREVNAADYPEDGP